MACNLIFINIRIYYRTTLQNKELLCILVFATNDSHMISKILFYSISNSRCYAVVSEAVVTKDTFIYTHDKLYYIVSPSMIHSADTVSIREGTMHVKIVYFKSMTKTVFSRPL